MAAEGLQREPPYRSQDRSIRDLQLMQVISARQLKRTGTMLTPAPADV
jgi:hypothetical protein